MTINAKYVSTPECHYLIIYSIIIGVLKLYSVTSAVNNAAVKLEWVCGGDYVALFTTLTGQTVYQCCPLFYPHTTTERGDAVRLLCW